MQGQPHVISTMTMFLNDFADDIFEFHARKLLPHLSGTIILKHNNNNIEMLYFHNILPSKQD